MCFREISPHLNDVCIHLLTLCNVIIIIISLSLSLQVIKVCLQLLGHDPNYNYDSGDDNDDEEAMETDEFDE